MPSYEIYGRTLLSGIELPELPPARAGGERVPPLTFERRLPPPPADGWFTIWDRPDGLPWVRAARTPSGYHVQYCNCAEFDLDLAGGAIAGADVNCAVEMFRHFLVDEVLPLMLSVSQVVLHASSVAIGGSLAAFAGRGGSGKSTIALALSRLGHPIGSDDGLLLTREGEATIAVPAYPGVRLWPDSERALASGLRRAGRPRALHAKRRFCDGLAFAGARALTHLFALDAGGAEEPAFERLSPRDAAIELVRQSYRLALDDRDALARQLDTLAVVASAVPAWRLSFPRDLGATAALAHAVDAHIQSHACPSRLSR